jgi:methylornithine synthase
MALVCASELECILEKARKRISLSSGEIEFLVNLEEADLKRLVFRTARELRHEYFGDDVFFYGFIYLSTYCRNNCGFCVYRKHNRHVERYRKSEKEILRAALLLASAGVHLIDLTMGEDPEFFQNHFETLIRVVSLVRKETGLPIMASPGVVPDETLVALRQAGARWYACYQETHSEELFSRWRAGQDYAQRLRSKQFAHEQGLLIEEGILCGLGESAVDIARSLSSMRRLQADQVRVMSFVPHSGVPLAKRHELDIDRELMVIAALRLAFPDRLIPASLDIEGVSGLKKRLMSGANVVTSLIPPGQGLAGVAQSTLDIEEGRRSISEVMRILKDCGLSPGSVGDYRLWMEGRNGALRAISGNR